MRTLAPIACALCLLAAAAADGAAQTWPQAGGFGLTPVATGLDQPLHLTAPSGDSRLFVVEQPGRIRIVRDGRLLRRPFLDLTDRVRSGGERGLLSVAFHPRYAENGWLFVNYTDRRGDTRIERYTVTRDPDLADPSSGVLVLHVDQPYANHNGGQVAFGPDGMLWIGMGDGGSGGDPQGHAQNLESLLGKMLRLDVDHARPYAIPPDNPFARGGGRPEIWAWGLRNPWRWAFQSGPGLLYVADVGQNAWEEVNVVDVRRPGLDFGWNVLEGSHCYRAPRCDRSRRVMPAVEYPHADGCSVTGGLVYRGRRIPALRGHYVFADYCSGWIRSFRWDGTRAVERRQWRLAPVPEIASFGEDARGELYVLSLAGTVYRVTGPAR
jgi:glucose/arabinose dehydrogenase